MWSSTFGKGIAKAESITRVSMTFLESCYVWRGKQVTYHEGMCVPNYG